MIRGLRVSNIAPAKYNIKKLIRSLGQGEIDFEVVQRDRNGLLVVNVDKKIAQKLVNSSEDIVFKNQALKFAYENTKSTKGPPVEDDEKEPETPRKKRSRRSRKRNKKSTQNTERISNEEAKEEVQETPKKSKRKRNRRKKTLQNPLNKPILTPQPAEASLDRQKILELVDSLQKEVKTLQSKVSSLESKLNKL